MLLLGGARRSENVHRSGATVGEQMRIGHRKGEDNIPVDHREESQHYAVRRELTRRHSHGSVEGHQTRHGKLSRSIQAIVQVTDDERDFCVMEQRRSEASLCEDIRKYILV